MSFKFDILKQSQPKLVQQFKGIGYLAPEGFVENLIAEIDPVAAVFERLVLTESVKSDPIWIQNIWYDPILLPVESINSAVKQLKKLQLRWAPYSFHLHRRSELIQQQLPKLTHKPIDFLSPLPNKKIGAWTLLSENLLLASPHCSSPFPNGEIHFNENKIDPPSRAYLKLWELFTVYGIKPKPGDICLDLGSSPGGWSWVLDQMNCSVISVDKAPLDFKLLRSPRIRYLNNSAFSISPSEIGRIDWFFSDLICYPERLFRLVNQWLNSGLCDNFVCTIKLQGDTDHEVIEKFKQIPGSKLVHLYNNKHELTWVHSKML